jgi:hypothetical protein
MIKIPNCYIINDFNTQNKPKKYIIVGTETYKLTYTWIRDIDSFLSCHQN